MKYTSYVKPNIFFQEVNFDRCFMNQSFTQGKIEYIILSLLHNHPLSAKIVNDDIAGVDDESPIARGFGPLPPGHPASKNSERFSFTTYEIKAK